MKRRPQVLKAIIGYERPISPLWKELVTFGWDCDDESQQVVLKKEDLALILDRYLAGEISARELEDWAEALECREDIEYEDSDSALMKDLFLRLSSPALYEALTPDLVARMKDELYEKMRLTNH